MTQITTTGGMITFLDTVTGLSKQIGQNQLWLQFSTRGDTVNFLRISIPTDGSDGTPFWSARASDLTIDGESYTIEQLKSGAGTDGLFSTMSFSYEIVEELPETGEPNIIYLVYDDETGTYTEYLWLAQEQTYEVLGSVADIDLGNYYTKSQTDTLLSAKADSSSLSTVATSGSYNDLSNTPNLAAVATSGSYSDLSNTPTIPTVPTNVSAFNNDAGYLTEHQSLSDYYTKSQTDNLLNGKQDTLVSGTNIKTINNESLLGSGNITITGGGSSVTVDSTWIPNSTNPVESQLIQSALADKANSSSLATVATSGAYSDLSGKPTNVSTFTNDAGYLTSHQSLADVFGDVLYDSQTKHINFYGKGDTQHTTVLAYVDAANFIVDGMVDTVEVKNATVSGQTVLCLVISFNTDAGKQDINIPISQIFDATNYYDKTDVDDLVAEAKPYYYEIGDTTEESYNEAYDAFREQRGIVLYGGSPSVYYPVTYTYANGTFRFTYLDSETGNVTIYSATHTDSRNTKSAGTVTWTQEAADNYELYYYELGNTDVDAFDGVVFGVDDNERALILFEDDGGRIHRYPASCSYDDVANTLYIGYTDVEGMPQAYTVTKQSGDAKAPASYEIVWEDVSPDFGVTIDSTWVQNSTNPAESQLIQSALGNKQDTLVSGTNIKTINNESILGSGNITISGGGSGTVTGVKMNNGSAINPDANGVVDLGTVVTTVDSALNASSTNPVENRAVYAAIGDIETALQILNGTNSNS